MFLGVLVRWSFLGNREVYCGAVFTELDNDCELAGLLAHVDCHCGGGCFGPVRDEDISDSG
jgi:hypothetical protein